MSAAVEAGRRAVACDACACAHEMRSRAADAPVPVFLPEGLACAYEMPYRVFDDVFCIRSNNPSPMSFEGTNTWVLHAQGSSRCAVVDPACDSREHLEAIEAFVRSRDARVSEVVITHDHPDHIAGMRELAQMHGARLLMRAEGALADGPVELCGGALPAQAIGLAGHSSDSVALLLEDDKALLSGDIFFSRGWTVIPAPDGNLDAYFDTLERVRALIGQGSVQTVLPGHREVMDAACALRRLDEYVAHRRKRLEKIRRAIAAVGSCDIDTVARHVYADVKDERLYAAAKMSLTSQMDYLARHEDLAALAQGAQGR